MYARKSFRIRFYLLYGGGIPLRKREPSAFLLPCLLAYNGPLPIRGDHSMRYRRFGRTGWNVSEIG